MRSESSTDFFTHFKNRYLGEWKLYTDKWQTLSDLRTKYNDELAVHTDIVHANHCVKMINHSLKALTELDVLGKEHSIDYSENFELFLAYKFFDDFKKGRYDKIHNETCKTFTESDIMQRKI